MENRPVIRDEIEELMVRAVVDVIVRDELEAKLRSGRPLRVKLGIDPTSPRIHLGRAVQLRRLKRFQRLGHQVQMVVGDFTARIGDASDKSSARPMLTPEQIESNLGQYRAQIGKIIDVGRAEFRYNSEWLGQLGMADVVHLASNFTVAQMLERENFTLRFQAQKPIGLHEFFYPLMQGYDSVALSSDIELGGTDQVFNLMAGRILQKAFGREPQSIITGVMIEGTDGRKMSSSWGNVISILDPPNEQFGRIMAMRDDLMVRYFDACTDVPYNEITGIAEALGRGEVAPLEVKKRLARETVTLYHSEAEAWEAQDYFERTVQRKELPNEIPLVEVSGKAAVLADLMVHCGLTPSKSEARRLVEQGGVQVDGVRVLDPGQEIRLTDGMVLKAGKRKFVRVSCIHQEA